MKVIKVTKVIKVIKVMNTSQHVIKPISIK